MFYYLSTPWTPVWEVVDVVVPPNWELADTDKAQ